MRYCATGRYYLFFYPAQKVAKGCYYFTLVTDLSKYAIIGLKTGHRVSVVLNDIWKTGQVYYSDNTCADMVHGWMKEASKRVI